MEGQQINFRRGLIISLGISVITILVLVFYTFDENTLHHLQQLKKSYLLGAFFITFMMWFVEALGIKIVAVAMGERLRLRDCLQIFFLGAFGSNITPFTSGGGPFQVFLIHREGVTLAKATTIVMARFALRLILFAVTAPLFYIIFNRMINPSTVGFTLFNILLIISIGITFFILFLVWKPELVMKLVQYIFSLPYLSRLYQMGPVQKGLIRLKRETADYNMSMRFLARKKKSLMVLAAFFTILYWFLFFSIIPLLLAGLGLEVHLLKAYVIQTVFFLVLPYMPTPGGSGVAELGIVSLFASLVPSGMLGILAGLWRFFTYYLVMGVSGLSVLKILKEKI